MPTKLVSPGQWKFDDREPCVIKFDDEYVLVPLNERELHRIRGLMSREITVLNNSGDFPESEEYNRTMEVINTALYSVSSRVEGK